MAGEELHPTDGHGGLAAVSLSTGRLSLRPMRGGDLAATIAALDDLEVSRRLARVPHPYTEADARAFLDLVARGRADGAVDHFVIVLRSDPAETPIGAIGVHGAPGSPVAEVGYWIARPHWRQGYAREALAAVVRRAFFDRTRPLEVLCASVHETNLASRRVLESCGFIEVGRCESQCLATGEAVPSLQFELRRA
jgi:RimJ/RimL family protein N-acetyltransferase